MEIKVNHRCSDFYSYRAQRVKSMFNVESGCNWEHVAQLPIESEEWQIGLIVGPSGSGKTSIGRCIFGEQAVHDLYSGWPDDKPVIDGISPEGNFGDVTGALSSVGLGDVPAWLRPFPVLSNGEKFRAGLARLICDHEPVSVVDEFTSVIDRQVAKVGASAFAKTWRKGPGKIVLLSCHYDIIEWLQPDWVYDTKEARFCNRDCLRQRPKIRLDIYKTTGKFWKYFQPHHYLKLPFPVAAEYYVGAVDGEPICHISVSPFFQCKGYRAMRLVVLPEWQGVGVGTKFLNEICRLNLIGKGRKGYKYPTFFHTSHPKLCQYLRNSNKWEQVSGVLISASKNKPKNMLKGRYGGHFRAIQGFKYLG